MLDPKFTSATITEDGQAVLITQGYEDGSERQFLVEPFGGSLKVSDVSQARRLVERAGV